MSWRKKFIFAVSFLFSVFYGVQASDSVKENSWVLAAMPFSFDKSDFGSEDFASVAESIPRLVLEQISSDAQRLTAEREILNRQLNELKKERLSLFLELSKAVKVRDAIALENLSEKALKKNLKAQQEKIDGLHKKISDNLLDNAGKTLEKEEDKNSDGFFSFFKGREEVSAVVPEKIQLYKNDFSVLFTPASNSSEGERFANSYKFENSVNSAGINGLIKGSITSYGDYAAVTAELYSFPGAALEGTVTEVGLLSNPLQLSRNLARALMPYVSNNPPVRLEFEFEPESVNELISVNFDGIIFSQKPDFLIVERGIHEFAFEAEGFKRVSFTYSFTERDSYLVKIKMEQTNPEKMKIRMQNPVSGIFSTYAIESAEISPYSDTAEILIDGKPVIAQFVSSEGNSTFFYIPQKFQNSNTTVTASALNFDVSKNIEKRRRRMYTAYTALILSLPFSFYYYGNYINRLNGNANGIIPPEDVNKWRSKALVSVGISVSLGAVFGYELVRYLHSANDALPENVKPEKPAKKNRTKK
ncbi:MAG: hypothetical protein PUA64_02040 [Treponema sp.]|nr:hypothetical protein [Treponema sp.]